MGFRVLGFSLLLIFIYLINLPPLHNALPSEFVQKSKFEEKVILGSKIEGGAGHGGRGGNSRGNGNSGSPKTQGGGAAVVPVYAAGAANKNHQPQTRHGDANCNLNKIRFSNMLIIILVYPLILSFLLI